MRIEDVKVGDVVILRPWTGYHRTLGELGRRERACHKLRRIVQVDTSDLTVELDCTVDGLELEWWPVGACESRLRAEANKPDQSNATQLLHHLHGSEVSDLRRRLDNAVKEAEAAERALTAARSEAATEAKVLRSQIAALEKQVADLKSERDRVGKTSQAGTRFAQLELD